MKKKIELIDIVSYLPYGLKGNLINNEYYEPVYAGELFRIETGLTTTKRDTEPFVIVGDYEDNIEYFTPILRPMNLTKSIAVDGKEIIPIVELAKIAYPGNDVVYDIPENKALINGWFKFYFNVGDFQCKTLRGEDQNPPNQMALFKKLYEWKMDVYGLIDLGLAIDADTLDVNPYNS